MRNLHFILIISTMLLINACGSNEKQTVNQLRKEVNLKKDKIKMIKKEIRVLQKEITMDKNDVVKDNRVLVDIKKLKNEKFIHYITQNGSVEAVKAAFISPETNGQIKKIYIKEGQFVNKGQILVKINSKIIENSIKEVKTALVLAKTVFEKRKGLWNKKIGSEIDYLKDKTNMESLESKLDTLNAQLEMSEVRAPISGIIETIYFKEGELAAPGVQLIQLIDLSKLYINTDISEKYIAAIKKGDWVEITFPSYRGLKIVDNVYFIGNTINIKNRTFKLKVLIENRKGKLKPNSIAIIKLVDFKSDNAIIIPSIIIKKDINGDYIYVVKNEKSKIIASKRYIKIGLSNQGKTMVLKGLNIAEKVIIQGYNMVKNGSEIRIRRLKESIFEKNKTQVIVNKKVNN